MIILPHARGSLSSGDQLALDLQFAADKTLTARKGPTPVFTRASTGTFIGSNGLIQSAAINAARFDHDPITLACKGLLMEESRTNIVFPSDTLTTQTRTVTAVAHTLSFYGAGTVVLSGTHSATVVGTGAYPTRTTLTFTPTAGSLTLTVTGSVTQAQLEVGGFPTSYIPTTTASVIRSADVCSITGSAFSGFHNQLAGTLYCSSTRLNPATAYGAIVNFNDGSSNNQFGIRDGGGAVTREYLIVRLGVSGFSSIVNGISFGLRKMVIAAEPNNANRADSGAIGTNDSSVVMPVVDRLSFGANHIFSEIKYYKKRLPNAKLQAITV